MKSLDPIIVIDDDLDDHFTLGEAARSLQLTNQLVFLRNGAEALDYLRKTKQNPFIIICDLNMPIMDGLTLRREINKDKRLRDKSIPFVFYSTAATKAQIKEAYELTVQGFFIKELSFEKIEKNFKLLLEYWDLCKHPNAN